MKPPARCPPQGQRPARQNRLTASRWRSRTKIRLRNFRRQPATVPRPHRPGQRKTHREVRMMDAAAPRQQEAPIPAGERATEALKNQTKPANRPERGKCLQQAAEPRRTQSPEKRRHRRTETMKTGCPPKRRQRFPARFPEQRRAAEHRQRKERDAPAAASASSPSQRDPPRQARAEAPHRQTGHQRPAAAWNPGGRRRE